MDRKLLNARVAREQAERALVAAERRGDVQAVLEARWDVDRLSKRIFWLETVPTLTQFDILGDKPHDNTMTR